MSDWPAHSAELSRKSLETLEMYVHQHAASEIDDRTLQLVADVLTEATQGLIEPEASQAIYAVSTEMRKRLPKVAKKRRPTIEELRRKDWTV